MNATQQDILQLDRLYEGRKPYYGELHDHSNSGVRGDGHNSLTEWKAELARLNMDFAALVDHRQVMHMLLPEWDDTVFIGGTEPGTVIRDSKAEEPSMHYNMIFYEAAQLEALLAEFPEYKFNEVRENEFVYSRFNTDRFQELIRWITGLWTVRDWRCSTPTTKSKAARKPKPTISYGQIFWHWASAYSPPPATMSTGCPPPRR